MGFIDNFEKTLNDFFFVNHPRKIKIIPQIISEFTGREKDVMLHLCKTYKVNPSTIEGLSSFTAPVVEAAPEPVAEKEAVQTEEVEVEETKEVESEVTENTSEESSEKKA